MRNVHLLQCSACVRPDRESAPRTHEAGRGIRRACRHARGSGAVSKALKCEPQRSASHSALSRQARGASSCRTAAQRSSGGAQGRSYKKTGGPAGGSDEGRKVKSALSAVPEATDELGRNEKIALQRSRAMCVTRL